MDQLVATQTSVAKCKGSHFCFLRFSCATGILEMLQSSFRLSKSMIWTFKKIIFKFLYSFSTIKPIICAYSNSDSRYYAFSVGIMVKDMVVCLPILKKCIMCNSEFCFKLYKSPKLWCRTLYTFTLYWQRVQN